MTRPQPWRDRALTDSTSEGYVEVNGHRTFYRTFGMPEKGTVLTLHGGPGATHDYMLPISELARSRAPCGVLRHAGVRENRTPSTTSLCTRSSVGPRRPRVFARHWSSEGSICWGTAWEARSALVYALKHQNNLRSLIVSGGFASTPLLTSEIHRLKSELPRHHLDAIERAEHTRQFKTEEYRARSRSTWTGTTREGSRQKRIRPSTSTHSPTSTSSSTGLCGDRTSSPSRAP